MGLSAKNPRVARLRKLSSNRKFRQSEGVFVLDSVAPIGEAVERSPDLVEALWVDEMRVVHFAELTTVAEQRGIEVHDLADGVLERSLALETSPGLAATVQRPSTDLRGSAVAKGFDLVLAGVGDPGNAGTMVRTAEAMGVTRVLATAGTVDLFAPKVVRASAGALLRLPVVDGLGVQELVDHCRNQQTTIVGAATRDGVDPGAIPTDAVANSVALVVGSEAHGLEYELERALDIAVTIPLAGDVESLNAAIAAAVIGFHLASLRTK